MGKTFSGLDPIKRNIRRVYEAAERGNSASMLKLGKHYLYKWFVVESGEEADFLSGIYWASKAAQNGQWEACFWLGDAIESWRSSNSSSSYTWGYIERKKRYNPVFHEIMERLNAEGFSEDSTSINFENVCKNNLAALFLWNPLGFGYVLESLDWLDCRYYRAAAEHGIMPAKARYGVLAKNVWKRWCDYLEDASVEEAKKILSDENHSLDDVFGYYKTARYWLLEALRDGYDDVVSDLHELINSKNRLRRLEKEMTASQNV